jgi:ribose 5-phosphate isomerase B
MKVYLATDHAGLAIKNKIVEYLKGLGFEAIDCGPFEFDKDDDYPDLISKAAQNVSENPEAFGIVFGGSGQGEAIVANKFKNVRCALFYSEAIPVEAIDISGNKSTDSYEMLKLIRAHNNSNMLSLGIRFLTEEQILKAVKIFLESPFPGDERHKRRIDKIKEIENKNYV